MKTGYYITSDGKSHTTADGITHPIKSQKTLLLSSMDIIKLVIPDDVKTVWCNNNKLSELILSDTVEKVWCYNNKLKELILPDGIKRVWCGDINIKDLNRFINNDNVRIDIML